MLGTLNFRIFAASDLVLYCLPVSHKKDARLIYWLIVFSFALMGLPISYDKINFCLFSGIRIQAIRRHRCGPSTTAEAKCT